MKKITDPGTGDQIENARAHSQARTRPSTTSSMNTDPPDGRAA